jgi:tetratricopeptide (TPR) repeat protein
MKLLPIAFLLKFPILPVEVSNFANQLSGIFEADEKKKLILSALTSLGLGFSLGITGGPINALIFGFVSTALSLLNSKVGSKVEKFSNKLSNFISSKVQSFLSPKLDFLSKLPKGLKALIGGLIVGGITALPASTLAGLLFPILGPLSFVIALSIFTATTLSTSKKILDLHNYKEKVFKTVDSIDKSIQNDDLKSALESYKELLKTNLNNSIQVDSLSEDQLRQALFNELYLMYLQKSFLGYQTNKFDEAIEYFRKAVAIQKVFEGMRYEEATKIANSLNSDQIMQYLKQYAENNEIKEK